MPLASGSCLWPLVPVIWPLVPLALFPILSDSVVLVPNKQEFVALTFYYKYNTHCNITNSSNKLNLRSLPRQSSLIGSIISSRIPVLDGLPSARVYELANSTANNKSTHKRC